MPLANGHASKTFVVTGATSGIGLALAPTAERLVIVGRNEARLQDAGRDVRRNGHRGLNLIPILGDLSTLDGIRSVTECLDRISKIDVLVHNAGVIPTHLRITVDGFEESSRALPPGSYR
jgi:retinol dehydrogenase 12